MTLARGYLFSDHDWFDIAQNQHECVRVELSKLQADRVLNTAPEDLAQYLAKKHSIEVPTLLLDQRVADQHEAQIDVSRDPSRDIRDRSQAFHVPGTTVEVTIPFSGEADAFRIRPPTHSLNPPRATISGNRLAIGITGTNLTEEQTRSQLERTTSEIQEHLDRLRECAAKLDAELLPHARQAVAQRREKLLADRRLVESLGIPLKERPGDSKTFAAPEVRRRITPTLPPASASPYKPEPTLTDDDYELILRVLHDMALVMERSPSDFRTVQEETLRWHFLVQLNGHYEGSATGETFNHEGKTDILIRSDGKNIFIGECAFWDGPKKFSEKIDQLLSYNSWRDTKAAILLFSRQRDFSHVLEAVDNTVQKHPNFKRLGGRQSETSFRYVFAHRDDRNRELVLTVLVFNVPT